MGNRIPRKLKKKIKKGGGYVYKSVIYYWIPLKFIDNKLNNFNFFKISNGGVRNV